MSVLLIFVIFIFIILGFYFLYNLFVGDGPVYMKGIWAILLIVLGVAFYFIYMKYFSQKSTLITTVYLRKKPATVIDAKSITDPNKANSSFALWLYVNSWNSNGPKTVFETSNNEISLEFETTKPTLFCKISTGCGEKKLEKVVITENFPLQKWCYVVVSVNGAYIDCFLDGKLITSHNLDNAVTTLTCAEQTYSILMGTEMDAYVYNLIRYTYSMNPQQAYSTYFSTSPPLSGTGLLSGMNINLAIVKDADTCNAEVIF